MHTPTNPTKLAQLLAIEDLTERPTHAICQMARRVAQSLPGDVPDETWITGPRIVEADHNYRLLGYPQDAVVQESTYTQWVDSSHILRTQTTSLILGRLLQLAQKPAPITLLAPGMVYRRDVRDRWHCGQPHQMDIWILEEKGRDRPKELRQAVRSMAMATTGRSYGDVQLLDTAHPYTQEGVEISVRWEDRWLEVGEAGLIDPDLLRRVGLDPERWGGWAMGWGLDRLVMARKDLPDIRLLRDPLSAVARQMSTLDSWEGVSRQPVAIREVSVAMRAGLSDEAVTEHVLALAGDQEPLIQEVFVVGRWTYNALPQAARDRLGMGEAQDNLLVRLTWQAEDDSLGRDLVNGWMKTLYRGLHEGSAWTYCP